MADASVRVKRIYEEPAADDGFRVLVDRLWPRGVSHERAALDLWLKDVAPSAELRTWFGHVASRMPEFVQRYRAELAENPAMDELRTVAGEHPVVTLLYAARDTANNEAVVLRDVLLGGSDGAAGRAG